MNCYNIIQDTIDISDESGPVSEPVTLEEIKSYLRLEGFIDDDDSTAVPAFTDDDTLIEELITSARSSLEEALGISIVNHTWRAIGVTNQAGNVQLKYGPVISVTSVLNESDTAYESTDIKATGDYLQQPRGCSMTIEYTAGWQGKLPKILLTEIKRMVAYLYENRGDVDGLEGYKYTAGVFNYSRKSWLA